MRPVLATLLALAILSSVGGYWLFVNSLSPASAEVGTLQTAAGRFSVDLTLTFDASSDAFAVDPTTILVRLEDHDVVVREPVKAGQPVRIDMPNLRVGRNAFYVEVRAAEASVAPAAPDAFSIDGPAVDVSAAAPREYPLERAVRVRVLRDAVPIAEQTLWSPAGQAVAGQVRVEVPADVATEVDHDH